MTEKQFNEITAWQKVTFPNATALSKIHHLNQEIQELTVELSQNKMCITEVQINTRLEFADCFLLLFDAAAANGMSYQDCINAIQEKFEINKSRKWGKPDENGVVNHIKTIQP